MIRVADASILVYLFDDQANAPADPATGIPVTGCRERVDHLVATLARQQDTILIPTPALAELLTRAGPAAPEWLRLLQGRSRVRVVAFDERHAIECAMLAARRQRPADASTGWRQKAKFDEQIVAIAIVERAATILSDDADIARLVPEGMAVVGIAALPLPPEDAQPDLPGLMEPPATDRDEADAPDDQG